MCNFNYENTARMVTICNKQFDYYLNQKDIAKRVD